MGMSPKRLAWAIVSCNWNNSTKQSTFLRRLIGLVLHSIRSTELRPSIRSWLDRWSSWLNSPFAAKSYWQKNHSSDWVRRNVWHIWHSYPIGIRTTIFSLATNEEDMPPYRVTCEKLDDLAADQGAYGVTPKKYLDAGNKIKVGRSFPYDMNDISRSSRDCSPSVQ